MAVARHRQGADLVLGRSARRQPGADRADGRRAQEPHVPTCLRTWASRRSRSPFPRPRRPTSTSSARSSRASAIPDGVAIQVLTQCRPELIERTFEAVKGAKKVILHFYNSTSTPPARSRLPHRPEGRHRHRGRRGEAGQGARRGVARAPISPSNIRPRASPAPSSISRWRSARRSRTSSGRRRERRLILNLPATVEMATPNTYADQFEWFGRHISDRDERDPLRPSAQRPRHRRRRGRTGADGRRRAGRGHAVRQWRAHRQRRHRHDGAEPVHARRRSRARPARRQRDQGDRRALQPAAGAPAPPLCRRTRLHRVFRLASGRDQEGLRGAGAGATIRCSRCPICRSTRRTSAATTRR